MFLIATRLIRPTRGNPISAIIKNMTFLNFSNSLRRQGYKVHKHFLLVFLMGSYTWKEVCYSQRADCLVNLDKEQQITEVSLGRKLKLEVFTFFVEEQ